MKGKELRQIRQLLSLSQQGMAEELGVSANTVARWERDEVTISGPAARLARLLLRIRCDKEG